MAPSLLLAPTVSSSPSTASTSTCSPGTSSRPSSRLRRATARRRTRPARRRARRRRRRRSRCGPTSDGPPPDLRSPCERDRPEAAEHDGDRRSRAGARCGTGAGAFWKSMAMPTPSAIRPEMRQRAVVTTCASMTSSATPRSMSTSPAQEIGSTEKPKSAQTSADRAERARAGRRPGWKISKPIPTMPARKSRQTMFGSISVVRKRVKKPGDDVRRSSRRRCAA